MLKYENQGLTMKFMSMISGMNPSTVSRYLSDSDIRPVPGSPKKNYRFPVRECQKILCEYVSKRHPVASNKKVQAFYNFKGGTGKTSICYQVATHLALCGYRVLLLDADPQSHLTVTLGYIDNFALPTLYDGIINNQSLDEIIIHIFEGLDLIPANLSLTNLEVRLIEMMRKEDAVKRYLNPLREKYDFIIFDCNPGISNMNRNILNFCDVLNIVCETHPYSVNGMKLLMEDLFRFYKTMELNLPEITIIPNKYEDRSNSSAEAMTALHKFYGTYLIPNFAVRKSEEFPKSARDQMPISFFCKANSIAFEDICDLLKIIIGKSEVKSLPLIESAA